MKNIFALLLLSLLTMNTLKAQDELKDWRFGLKFAPSLSWLTPQDEKRLTNEGVGFGYEWGLMLERKLSNSIQLRTGFFLSRERGNLSFNDSVFYQLNTNDEFEEITNTLSDTAFSQYLLSERNYTFQYITIPLSFKMHTKEIGYFVYFLDFGLQAQIKTKAQSDDKVFLQTTGGSNNELNLSDLSQNDDTQPFKLSLTVGGGAEYNISGTTALLIGLNYNIGFTNSLKKNSRYVSRPNAPNGQLEPFRQIAQGNAVMLSLGVLF